MNIGDGHRTKRFSAENATFTVRCPSTELRDAVEALLGDLHDGDPQGPCREIALTLNDAGLLDLRVEDGHHVAAQRPDSAIASVVTAISRLALDTDPSHLHLHCAALARDGKGVLISAASGTGKTTLAAALALRGWTYVSDEAVALGVASTTATGFCKPLVIKSGGRDLIPELDAARIPLSAGEELWWHVPVGAMPAPTAFDLEPSVVVILYRMLGEPFDIPPVPVTMHPVDAVVALFRQTMDAERFGADALLVLAQLAARCLCVALPVGPLDASTAVLEELVQMPLEPEPVVQLEQAKVAVGGWRVAESVRSVVIGERAAAYDTKGLGVASMDEAGTAVWLALHGDAPPWWEPDIMQAPSTVAFLDQLNAHGLLAEVAEQPMGN